MTNYRVETKEEISAYLDKLRYALDSGARLIFQATRRVDETRDEKYTNQYTVAHLFPDEDPQAALRRELRLLTVRDYLRTVKDTRFPKKSEMREFGKTYHGTEDVYIFGYKEDGEDFDMTEITDEEEFEKVCEIFDKLVMEEI